MRKIKVIDLIEALEAVGVPPRVAGRHAYQIFYELVADSSPAVERWDYVTGQQVEDEPRLPL